MKISKQIAQKIVREIANTVQQNVNLMDETGLVIASTNKKRIGTYHTGAKKIVEEKLDCLPIYEDGEYSGARMGINMPISFKGSIVGVLGISGEWKQIERYIPLIRKTTEIILMNRYLEEKENVMKKEQKQFLYNFLFEKRERLSEEFLQSAAGVGLDMSLERRCICISFQKKDKSVVKDLSKILAETEKIIEMLFENAYEYIIYRDKNNLIVFVPNQTDTELLQLIQRLKREVHSKISNVSELELKVGIDDKQSSGLELRDAKKKAEKSLLIAMSEERESVIFYKDIMMGILINEIPEESRKEYLKKLFHNMSENEMKNWIELLKTFYACEGSIAKTAEKLYIHKNTLQYRLKKLAALTGYDPRNLSEAGIYQIAIWFLKSA